MAEFYEMPAVSPTMEFGTLVEWRIAEGERFESGAVVAEVGTDKANMDAEIFDKGVMIKHLAAQGDEIPPGAPIAIWGQSADEDISKLLEEFEARKGQAAQAPAPKEAAEPAQVDRSPVQTEERPAAASPRPAPSAAPAATAEVKREWMGKATHHLFMDPNADLRIGAPGRGRPRSTPLARKMADDRGIDLHRIEGSGPGGRIVAADLERAPRAPAGPAPAEDTRVKNSQMRRTIARRLLESHQQIPSFFLTATFDMQGFVDLRADLKARLPDLKVSYNDILVRAVARALVDHPEVNASWGDAEIVRHGRVDIGVAVAIDEGLITPVIRGADKKGLAAIAGEVRELAGRAKKLKLQPDEYTGGTFTISNLGMMEIEHFTAIINPPESAILAVGAIEQVPVVVDGALTVGWRMKVTMTCDHRVIDGAVGAAFLQTLRRYVESPSLLLV